jgi:ArsR family transcriptional regulator, virulence genes transcriptional regulator
MSKRQSSAHEDPMAQMQQHADEASCLLKAMGNEQRLLVLCQLVGRELSVSDLQARIKLSQSALSQHLAVLREAGMVETRRSGQNIFYSLPEGPVRRVMQTLHDIYCSNPTSTTPSR